MTKLRGVFGGEGVHVLCFKVTPAWSDCTRFVIAQNLRDGSGLDEPGKERASFCKRVSLRRLSPFLVLVVP